MRDTSDDAFAAMQAGEARQRELADARHLSGSEVATLRRALDAAQRALSRINERGLAYAHRRDITTARTAIVDAHQIVAPRWPTVSEDTG